MRLILIYSGRAPPHVQLWVFSDQRKIALDISTPLNYNLRNRNLSTENVKSNLQTLEKWSHTGSYG